MPATSHDPNFYPLPDEARRDVVRRASLRLQAGRHLVHSAQDFRAVVWAACSVWALTRGAGHGIRDTSTARKILYMVTLRALEDEFAPWLDALPARTGP